LKRGLAMNQNENKYLSIFYNYKETASLLPKKQQGEFWRLVINYAFDGEKSIENDLNCAKKETKIAFLSIKNILKLNKKAGSQNGKSNNSSGLAKGKEPIIALKKDNNNPIPYIKEKKIKEYKYNGNVIKLNEKDFNDWEKRFPDLDLKYNLEKIDIWLSEKIKEKPEYKARWFFMVQQMLLKKQNEAKSKNTYMGRG